MAAVGREHVVTLHDLSPNTPSKPHRLVGHEPTVFRAIYSPDGNQLATVGIDMTVRLWDLQQNTELFALRLPAQYQPPKSLLWDFDFQCKPQGGGWIAVPPTVSRLALYYLPYAQPPASLVNAP